MIYKEITYDECTSSVTCIKEIVEEREMTKLNKYFKNL